MRTNRTDSRLKRIFDCFGSLELHKDTNTNTIQMPNITVKGTQAMNWLLSEVTKSREEFVKSEQKLSDSLEQYKTTSYIKTAVWLRTNDMDVITMSKCSLVKE